MRQRILFTLLSLLLTTRLCGAAITAATIWEVRPNTGDNTFGACFDSTIANAGTDYSQQATAQLALTDIAITTTAVTSTTGGFTAAMIGNCLRLNTTGTGAHCVLGWYQVTAFTSSTAVTIDRDATTGGAGVACSGKVGGATKSLSGQTTTALSSSGGAVAGNKVWIKNETWAENATLNGNNTVTWEGYNATRGDAPTGATRPHNNTNVNGAALTISSSNNVLKSLWFSVTAGANNGITDSGLTTTYSAVRSSGNTAAGFALSGTNFVCLGCEADTNTTSGFALTGAGLIVGSYVHGNTTTGITTSQTLRVVDSIIAANLSHGIDVSASVVLELVNNTINGNTGATTDGLNLEVTNTFLVGSLVLNNIFSNNGRDGVRVVSAPAASTAQGWVDYNDYSGNGGVARTNFPTGAHDVTTNPTYTNSGSGDFSIGTPLRNLGFPGTFPASTSVGHLDVGAVQSGAGSITQGACHRTVQ